MRGRHVQWLLDQARQFEQSIDGPDQVVWLQRMDLDLDNVRAALQWGKLEVGERASALQMATHLRAFWWRRGHSQEACQHLEHLLNLVPDGKRVGIAAEASALHAIGWLRNRQGDPAATRPPVQAALALRRAQGAGLQPIEQPQMERQLAPARRMLDEAAASQAWAEGEAMTPEQLVACALEEPRQGGSLPGANRKWLVCWGGASPIAKSPPRW